MVTCWSDRWTYPWTDSTGDIHPRPHTCFAYACVLAEPSVSSHESEEDLGGDGGVGVAHPLPSGTNASELTSAASSVVIRATSRHPEAFHRASHDHQSPFPPPRGSASTGSPAGGPSPERLGLPCSLLTHHEETDTRLAAIRGCRAGGERLDGQCRVLCGRDEPKRNHAPPPWSTRRSRAGPPEHRGERVPRWPRDSEPLRRPLDRPYRLFSRGFRGESLPGGRVGAVEGIGVASCGGLLHPRARVPGYPEASLPSAGGGGWRRSVSLATRALTDGRGAAWRETKIRRFVGGEPPGDASAARPVPVASSNGWTSVRPSVRPSASACRCPTTP